MKEGKFVEKLGPLIKATRRGEQNLEREASFWGAQAFPCASPEVLGEASACRSTALAQGEGWVSGIARWHCDTVFQLLFLHVRVNVQSWKDRQPWSSCEFLSR